MAMGSLGRTETSRTSELEVADEGTYIRGSSEQGREEEGERKEVGFPDT